MQKRCPKCNHWLNKNELECTICKHKIGDGKMVGKAEFEQAVDAFVKHIDRVTSEMRKKYKNNDTNGGLWWCFALKGPEASSKPNFAFVTEPVGVLRIISNGMYIPCKYNILQYINIEHGKKHLVDVFMDTITDKKFLKDVVVQICHKLLPEEFATPFRMESCECGFIHPKTEPCPICKHKVGEKLDD